MIHHIVRRRYLVLVDSFFTNQEMKYKRSGHETRQKEKEGLN